MSLVLLPGDKIVPCFEVIVTTLRSQGFSREEVTKIDRLLDYVKRTWLTQRMLQDLSLFDATWTTTNYIESYHSGLKRKIRTKSPNFFTFIKHLDQVVEDHAMDQRRIQNGVDVGARRKKKVQRNFNHRRKWKNELLSGSVTPFEYLCGVSHTLDLHHEQFLDVAVEVTDETDEDVQDPSLLQPPEAPEAPTENQIVQDVPLCCVCMEPRNGVYSFFPCRHAHTCADCAAIILASDLDSRKCPSCRAVVEDVERIFI